MSSVFDRLDVKSTPSSFTSSGNASRRARRLSPRSWLRHGAIILVNRLLHDSEHHDALVLRKLGLVPGTEREPNAAGSGTPRPGSPPPRGFRNRARRAEAPSRRVADHLDGTVDACLPLRTLVLISGLLSPNLIPSTDRSILRAVSACPSSSWISRATCARSSSRTESWWADNSRSRSACVCSDPSAALSSAVLADTRNRKRPVPENQHDRSREYACGQKGEIVVIPRVDRELHGAPSQRTWMSWSSCAVMPSCALNEVAKIGSAP